MEMIPNWHPMLVHFTIALALSATGLFLAAFLLRAEPVATQLIIVARWNLWLAAASAVPTVAAGLQAYYSVAHDEASHVAMTIHLKWALATLALLGAAAYFGWRERARAVGTSAAFAALLVVAAVALSVTAYLGGENVYRYGLGVMSMPKAEGVGHDHHHDAGGAAADAAAEEPAAAHATAHQHATGALSHTALAPAATVDALFAALKAGDLAQAKGFLDPGVRIFESGDAERSAEEYAAHHLPADAAFLKDATQEITARTGDAIGDLAWIASEQRIKAVSHGKPIELISTETMVLRRTDAGWRIIHIHWSSRPVTERS